ncbi:uncharacterized protein LOC141632377 [Silene latifolia]|uniref:uncharacterized protein LOC141632377 n=1 Tax=Silene latifolia TaxID=37657 RepID=UPI003D773CD1
MGKQEVANDAHVATGTFLVHNTPSFVLFDSEATHSFVSRSHAIAMGLGEYELMKDNVFIPSGESLSCSKLYMDVSMVVGEVDLPVNLLEFPMDGFEVIVGMNWFGKKKCPLILCHVRDMYVEELSATDITVGGEFGDVFPDDISGLPPKRDIDFSVEIKPGMRPISKAAYQIGPKKLEELKKQLDELLDKGYIQPSVSPWGVSVLC